MDASHEESKRWSSLESREPELNQAIVDVSRMQSMNENDFECLAKTRVNAPGTMFPIAPEFLYFVSLLRFVRVSVSVGNDWSTTKLANLRIAALELNGRRLAVANLAIPWTIVHASSAN